MQYVEHVYQQHRHDDVGTTLTSAEVSLLADLIAELRELTLSRATYRAATEMLKRFGRDVDVSALVMPEAASH